MRLRLTHQSFKALVLLPLFLPFVVQAQTALKLPAMPNQAGQARQEQASQIKQTPKVAPISLPKQVITQAEDQFNGIFPTLNQPDMSGGQIQEAWNMAKDHAGVTRYNICRDCVYRARLRQFMVTAFEVPAFETITSIDVGDPKGFLVQTRSSFQFAVKPTGYGLDSNILVYTKSGATYAFYVRSENAQSAHISDFIVKIGDSDFNAIKANSVKIDALKPLMPLATNDKQAINKGQAKPHKITTEIPYDPAKLRGWNDYDIWGSDKKLIPKMVYRDDYFTYIHFGKKLTGLEFPTAFVVVDGIDEIINMRVDKHANNGQTLVIESVHPLITLKAGISYICLKYEGDA